MRRFSRRPRRPIRALAIVVSHVHYTYTPTHKRSLQITHPPCASLAPRPGQAAVKECGVGSDAKRGQPGPGPPSQQCNQHSRKRARRLLHAFTRPRYQSALGPISAQQPRLTKWPPRSLDATGRFALVGRSQANPKSRRGVPTHCPC